MKYRRISLWWFVGVINGRRNEDDDEWRRQRERAMLGEWQQLFGRGRGGERATVNCEREGKMIWNCTRRSLLVLLSLLCCGEATTRLYFSHMENSSHFNLTIKRVQSSNGIPSPFLRSVTFRLISLNSLSLGMKLGKNTHKIWHLLYTFVSNQISSLSDRSRLSPFLVPNYELFSIISQITLCSLSLSLLVLSMLRLFLADEKSSCYIDEKEEVEEKWGKGRRRFKQKSYTLAPCAA